MATKARKDKPVNLKFKLPKSLDLTGKTVKMEVYDELDALDAGQSGAMSQIGASSRYKGTFTPDENGAWRVEFYVEDDTTLDRSYEFMRDFSVGDYDNDDIGALSVTIEGKVDNVASDVTDIKASIGEVDPPMIG